MPSVADAKKELTFHREFTELIEIIKEIAASQFRSLESNKEERFAKFLESFDGFFEMLGSLKVEDVFTAVMSDVTGLILVTSDEGFMGGLNSKVIHAGLEKTQNGKRNIIVVGEQGANYLKDLKLEYTAFPGVAPEERYERAVALKDFIVGEVLKKKMGRVFVSYPKPVSLTAQTAEVMALLPFTEASIRKETEPIHDDKDRRVIMESSLKGIMDYLAGMWMTYKLYNIFEDSKLAELSARMMSLEESYGALSQKEEVLQHRYFRAYHEMVDKGMREIFASKLLSGRNL